MTAWQPPDPEEVALVYTSLAKSFMTHTGASFALTLFDASELEEPPETAEKARALWHPLRVAWATHGRLDHKKPKPGSHLKGPAGGNNREKAIVTLERAAALLANSFELLRDDALTLAGIAKQYGVPVASRQQHDMAGEVNRLAIEAQEALEQLKLFKGVRQIFSRREWDDFISESAEALQVVFTSREVAALLTGAAPEEIDRATLERFRQRVRRRRIAET